MIIPDWIRLDNAALIYPSCRTRRYATQFRLSATLDKDVSVSTLDRALKNIIGRFPGFAYTLSKGLFWWYLRRLENEPSASISGSMNVFSLKDNGGYMFKAGCSGRTITLDVFHALTDGNGAMTFLMSLVSEYLRLTGEAEPVYGTMVLNPSEAPAPEEIEDSFDAFSGLKGNLDREEKAWHIPGKSFRYDELDNLKVGIPTEEIAAKASEKGCTVTEYLAAMMLVALQEAWKKDPSKKKSPFIVIEVPVNLRPLFGSRTLRNFSSYIHVGLDVRNGFYDFDETIREVRMQKALFLQKNRLTTRVAANVALEDNLAIRCIPLLIKKMAINVINSMKGDTYCTYTLSNLGRMDLTGKGGQHLREMDFVLGRQWRRSGACACVSCGGKLNLNFSRKIKELDFEKAFLGLLASQGISSSLEFSRVASRDERKTQVRVLPMRRSRIGLASSLLFI